MSNKKLQYTPPSEDDMARASGDFLAFMRQRRTVREFSNRDIPIEVVKNIVSTAASAPVVDTYNNQVSTTKVIVLNRLIKVTLTFI